MHRETHTHTHITSFTGMLTVVLEGGWKQEEGPHTVEGAGRQPPGRRVVQSWCKREWGQIQATVVIEGCRSKAAHDRPSLSETETLAEDRWSHHRGIPTASAWRLLLTHTKKPKQRDGAARQACWMATKLHLGFLFQICKILRFVHLAAFWQIKAINVFSKTKRQIRVMPRILSTREMDFEGRGIVGFIRLH